ncbi:MAG: S-methyl-5'-thioadenosine phosphorylase [Candidatus Omnitrophica bacterium]|jgi:5'-methylthioadenosine phosphorylase|nr:S-methyl-5'-thioadenosine phosphorylase [Candidatus Omnitrophota bacterium]
MSKLGIIGGSGLYDMPNLRAVEWIGIRTPFGKPSDKFLRAELSGRDVIFLPRHGRGHHLLPGEINNAANIYAMKKLGVDTIISVSTVGSLRQEIKPMDIVIPDQYVDRTNQARSGTLFGNGLAAHITFSDPVCPVLSKLLFDAASALGLPAHAKGVYLNMEGPSFSTRAESNLYRSWGMDIIGMTNLHEARCAREAEICYATLAMVTDYDCWHESDNASVDIIIQNLSRNIDNAKKILETVSSRLPQKRDCLCAGALKGAIITKPAAILADVRKRLDIIIGKYL